MRSIVSPSLLIWIETCKDRLKISRKVSNALNSQPFSVDLDRNLQRSFKHLTSSFMDFQMHFLMNFLMMFLMNFLMTFLMNFLMNSAIGHVMRISNFFKIFVEKGLSKHSHPRGTGSTKKYWKKIQFENFDFQFWIFENYLLNFSCEQIISNDTHEHTTKFCGYVVSDIFKDSVFPRTPFNVGMHFLWSYRAL